ncbi:NAD(P)/FAD-dependent oxidoreductase [Pseudoroseicyclus tamaricis]|uniref:FAD-binding oxidoreductase n=1 Tax=Pseudoroseicyclus tamaricis TaxID=2705421 RepID=A0A6B2JVZ0_9RHOB|nr:FAD-binding oxidoreductase [Pseudoroseicyclus tamaricis]NDV00384.1 FAD-binding oxidoreductase [Pseudoroseicyclus tamaricis]
MNFPFTMDRPAEHRGELPEAADAVIIGGGIVGVMAGWFLARAGLKAVLVEKGRVAAEQSGRNWGFIRQQARDVRELPIMVEANRLWPELAERTGEDIGLRQGGVLYMADNARDMETFARHEAEGRAHGTDIRLLSRPELADLLPDARWDWRGGVFTPSDMSAEPWKAVPAFARAAVRDGLTIREGCAARGLELTAGQVSGVVTEDGVIRTERVLLAGGAWSRLFLGPLGVRIPQASVRATVVATEPMPGVFGGGAVDGRLGLRHRQDGGYTLAPGWGHEVFVGPDLLRSLRDFLPFWWADPMENIPLPAAPRGFPDAWGTPRRWDGASPFEAMRILAPEPSRRRMAFLPKAFHARFPGLPEPKVRAAWAGMIDVLPDQVPIVDAVAPVPGLWLGTGLSGHGFGIGPGVGRVLADLMQGKAPGHDLSGLRFGRFGG